MTDIQANTKTHQPLVAPSSIDQRTLLSDAVEQVLDLAKTKGIQADVSDDPA